MPKLSNDSAFSAVSRRSFLRSASAAVAAIPILTEAHLAHAASYASTVPQYHEDGIHKVPSS